MTPYKHVYVEAPARLHVGFMDLHGGLGRTFGSLGVALEGLSTRLSARRSSITKVTGVCAERAHRYAIQLCQSLNIEPSFEIAIESSVPRHAGLGSGTQMAMAVGSALNQLYELNLTPLDIGRILNRGARSGIGIGAFEGGGFMIDGGRLRRGAIPRITSRIDFPSDWRILLIMDDRNQGLHGPDEKNVFKNLPPFQEEKAAMLCRVVVMSILPALIDEDLAAFGQGIRKVQHAIGDYFAESQSGRYSSQSVARVLSDLEQRQIYAIGQSSWGPTGFAVVENEAQASKLQIELQSRYADEVGLTFKVVQARNQGGVVTGITNEKIARNAINS